MSDKKIRIFTYLKQTRGPFSQQDVYIYFGTTLLRMKCTSFCIHLCWPPHPLELLPHTGSLVLCMNINIILFKFVYLKLNGYKYYNMQYIPFLSKISTNLVHLSFALLPSSTDKRTFIAFVEASFYFHSLHDFFSFFFLVKKKYRFNF